MRSTAVNALPTRRIHIALAAAVLLAGCGGGEAPDSDPAATDPPPPSPDIQALNAFYYYEDVEAAWRFYTDVLGFETSADYGFAKILRVAEHSYLTLVDAARGMHTAQEPKAVTLAVVTEQVEAWYDYLIGRDVPMRHELGEVDLGRAHNGFVAVDPEGYLLEFERFNPHEENGHLLPLLDRATPLSGNRSGEAEGLTVQSSVLWLYYEDLARPMAFYEALLGEGLLVDQGWAKVYRASDTGFVGLVDGSRGLHQAVSLAGVTVSFFTSDVEGWLERARVQEVPLREDGLGDESGRVVTFVGFDPGGYFLEWDTFVDVPENRRLLEELGG